MNIIQFDNMGTMWALDGQKMGTTCRNYTLETVLSAEFVEFDLLLAAGSKTSEQWTSYCLVYNGQPKTIVSISTHTIKESAEISIITFGITIYSHCDLRILQW